MPYLTATIVFGYLMAPRARLHTITSGVGCYSAGHARKFSSRHAYFGWTRNLVVQVGSRHGDLGPWMQYQRHQSMLN
jgi:hypothetical protein